MILVQQALIQQRKTALTMYNIQKVYFFYKAYGVMS